MRDTLTDPRTVSRGYFDQSYVGLLFDEHHRRRRDHSWRLWSLFVLELWHRQFMEDSPRAHAGGARLASALA
jgi:asparagine synthase (glutamine-hydrolysing)